MKKLLFLCTILFSLTTTAQGLRPGAGDTVEVVDTLHYYFNKYYFKEGELNYSKYPYYKDPAPKCKNASITHVGSRFENAVGDLTITGLEAFAAMPGTTIKPKIPVHLYLFNIGSDGKPVWPALDSALSFIDASYKVKPKIVGDTLQHGPRVVSGDFAVMIRNFSDVCGDTVLLLRTSCLTDTYVATPAGWTSHYKYADGNYGFIRYGTTNANFVFTKNFTGGAGFGVGTDYEFMVAPRVKYRLQASQEIPQIINDFNDGNTTDTICTRTNFTFKNRSSWQFGSRFYNLNEFYRKWNLYYPFAAVPVVGNGFSADTAITWNFEFLEQIVPPIDPRKFLPYRYPGTNPESISVAPDQAGCWDNQFRASLRPMCPFGRQDEIKFNIPFRICLSFCEADGTGISENSPLKNVSMYPNPSTGTAIITGLVGENDIRVSNVLGQEVLFIHSNTSEQSVNLSQLPQGTYLVKIQSADKQSRTIRMVIGQ